MEKHLVLVAPGTHVFIDLFQRPVSRYIASSIRDTSSGDSLAAWNLLLCSSVKLS